MLHVDFLQCHFHKVESCTWLRIREVLNKMLVARIEAEGEFIMFKVDNYDFDTIRDFVEQMDTAYLHPRRDSMYVQFMQSIYSNWRVPSNFLGKLRDAKRRVSSLTNAPTKKNLSVTPSASSPSAGLGQACISFLAIVLLFLFASHLEYLESLL